MTREEELELVVSRARKRRADAARETEARLAAEGARRRMNPLAAGALGALDGVTLGFADEAAGLVNDEWRQALRDQYSRAKEDQGAAFFGGQVASAFVPGLGAIGAAGRATRLAATGVRAARNIRRAAKGFDALAPATTAATKAGLGARVAEGAVTGAVTGGVYGVGSGEGAMDRVTGGVGGAAAGAMLGGAIPAAIAGAKAVGERAGVAKRAVKQSWFGGAPDTSRAEGLLFQRLQHDLAIKRATTAKGRVPVEDTATELQRRFAADRARGGSAPTLLDLGGDNVGGLVETSAMRPGPGRQMMRDEIERRIENQGREVLRATNRATGRKEFHAALREIEEEGRRAAAPLYAELEGVLVHPDMKVSVANPRQGYDDTLTLGQLLARPSVERATNRAIALAQETGHDLNRLGLREGGELTLPDGRINLRLLDWIKRGLDDEIMAAKNPLTGMAKTDVGAMKRTAAQLTAVLDELVKRQGRGGLYQAAREAHGSYARLSEAMDIGRSVFSPGRHSDWLNELDDFAPSSPQEREALLLGLRDVVLERAWSAKDAVGAGASGGGADLYRRLLGDKAVRQRIAALFGPIGKNGGIDPKARRFFGLVRAEAEKLRNIAHANPRANSATARRQIEAEATDDALAEAMVNVLSGNVVGGGVTALRQLLQGLLGKSPLTSQEAAYVVREAVRPLKKGGAAAADDGAEALPGAMGIDEMLARYRTWANAQAAAAPYHALAPAAATRGVVGYERAPVYLADHSEY